MNALANCKVPDRSFNNSKLIDGYAYTVDNFMVYKLYVYQIPYTTTLDDVRQYFSMFDNIKNVHFVNVKDLHSPKMAFVHFENPKAAARVLHLHNRHFTLNTSGYRVKVCDSWHQPNCKHTKEILQDWYIRLEESEEEDKFVPPNKNSILSLNDDCLVDIIRFLPISNQLQFARSSSRICQLFDVASKSMYRTLSLERLVNMTQWQIKDFFDFVGDYIIRIEGKLPKVYLQRILKYIGIFCNNLEELHLDSSEEIYSIFRFRNLFTKLQKLKTLTISKMIRISGKELSSLSPTIESLSIHCISVNDEHLISLSKSLTNLKELQLGLTFRVSDNVANALTVSCPNLKNLTLSDYSSDYSLVTKLTKLKKTSLSSYRCGIHIYSHSLLGCLNKNSI